VRLLLLLLLFVSTGWAQDNPELTWQGRVDGTTILYITSDHLDVVTKEGAPVTEQQFHFYHPLPQTRQDAHLRVREGRGYVHIVDQPRIDNRFTLAIEIDDRQPGSAFYSIAVDWNSSDRAFEHSRGEGRTDTLVWSGRVAEDITVSCRAQSCASVPDYGAPVAAEKFKFTRPLPDRAVEVKLARHEGRGEIRLVEQPSERNHYTARVSIHDPQSGSSDYSFTLTWNRSAAAAAPPAPSRGLLWTATVAGRVRVTLSGGAAFAHALDSGQVSNQRADFVEPLPARSGLIPAVKILQGRGQASIVEIPSEQNHYELVFEIDDPGPGTDNYQVEVDW